MITTEDLKIEEYLENLEGGRKILDSIEDKLMELEELGFKLKITPPDY